ncbi:MAG: hypothetical protein IIY48_08110 [Clostridia bacterium]|nr:hypothetical protein [Clostridia bacterium]MBQ1314503.1 hypothetical protein [Clostridia bacterium]MBQ1529940.1 hypothetical protein [Clostridia bacterium]MBQ1706418.1 hypothetical protein [Clostridia bacterium]MBQ5580860.1 hypothetical protein [Clostridia bacterium]
MQNHIAMSCRVCPRGCFLEATKEAGEDWAIVGNDCERGPVFMRSQLAESQPGEDDSDIGGQPIA